MARRRAHYRDRHRSKVYQDSPFLDLPAEIRNFIYRAALYKPTPIDLWPIELIPAPAEDPALTARIAKAKAEPGVYNERYRHQKDLEYVRKEMATGLLCTCTQIFKEAQHIFWRDNTFRFSGDREYFGARRFLGSIGPRALSQIRILELFAPTESAMTWSKRLAEVGYEREAKNHPKMHMVKAAKKLGDTWISDYDVFETNLEHTLTLLEPVRASIELKFIVPPGWMISSVTAGWNERSNQWDTDVPIPSPSLLALSKFSKRMSFVVERGAVVMDTEVPTHVIAKGIDFICLAGSSLVEHADQAYLEIKETKRWEDSSLDLDILVGVSDLFQDPFLVPSVPNRGGRVTKFTGQKTTERRLRGFGGCVFVQTWGCDCGGCNRTLVHLHNEHLYLCANCGFYNLSYANNWRWVDVLRKPRRAEARGQFPNATMYQGLYPEPPPPVRP